MKRKIALIILIISFWLIRVEAAESALLDFLNFSNIPTHPLLNKIEEQNSIINGARTKTITYKAENDINIFQVIDFYKSAFMQKGWNKSGEYLTDDYCAVNFMDDDWRAFSFVITKLKLPAANKETVVAKAVYLQDGMKNWIFKDNKENNEMPGNDISWFPRYPGAMRIQSVENYYGATTAVYQIVDYSCIQCVMNFYKEHMLKINWRLINLSHQDKEQINDFNNRSAAHLKNIITRLKDSGGAENDYLGNMGRYQESSDVDIVLPSESYGLRFEKKNEVCEINIIYKEAQEGLSPVEEMNKALSAGGGEGIKEEDMAKANPYLQEYLEKIRPYYYQAQGNKEAVMISVVYTSNTASPYSSFRYRRVK